MDSDNPNQPQPANNQPQPQQVLPEAVIAWKRHPVTQEVLKFLRDYADQLRADHADRFESGQQLPPSEEDRARGYINGLRDMAAIEAKTINYFYNPNLANEEFNGNSTNSKS